MPQQQKFLLETRLRQLNPVSEIQMGIFEEVLPFQLHRNFPCGRTLVMKVWQPQALLPIQLPLKGAAVAPGQVLRGLFPTHSSNLWEAQDCEQEEQLRVDWRTAAWDAPREEGSLRLLERSTILLSHGSCSAAACTGGWSCAEAQAPCEKGRT